jgi:predicted ribosome quality control (RQC) complex YloA/Tae2 family protein
VGLRQVAADRLLLLEFDSVKGTHTLVAELMGKHSNLVLLDEEQRIVSAAKWVGHGKSARPILPRGDYVLPPVVDENRAKQPSPATPGEWAKFAQDAPGSVSPFFQRLIEAGSQLANDWSSFLAPGEGAYPIDLRVLGISGFERPTISIALEQHFAIAVSENRTQTLRASLSTHLNRVRLARETAIADLRQVLAAGANASKWQRYGELVLAYCPSVGSGASWLEAWDYDGYPVKIQLDPELDFKQNAAGYFERARRAKSRMGSVHDQMSRLEADLQSVYAMLQRAESTDRYSELEDLLADAKRRRWFSEQPLFRTKEDRPYEGHRIRELLGPGGIRVLYGENAESNDYLTLRVARPNDYWLHIRGSVSAHVVIVTGNHPERIGREHLMFAAKVAVQNSPSKHAGFVPVDYTLKRHVRRPRGAPKGTALYTNEKTLHVES